MSFHLDLSSAQLTTPTATQTEVQHSPLNTTDKGLDYIDGGFFIMEMFYYLVSKHV